MTPEGLGLHIRQRRQALGLTMDQAARRAGINKGTLSSIELYYVNRVPNALPAIAIALETTPDFLLAPLTAAGTTFPAR